MVIYYIGNVEFKQDDAGKLKMIGEKELVSTADLLGVSSHHLREALFSYPKLVSDLASSNILTVCHANSNIRSLTRTLYTRLLGVILRRINDQLLRYILYLHLG